MVLNDQLISHLIPTGGECSQVAASLHVLPDSSAITTLTPPSLLPTSLQQIIPHEGWVDNIPSPIWRDKVLLALGTFDEDDLWSDTIGGLFEGYPADEIEHRGLLCWDTPWDINGWEMSEGFWRKWGYLLGGCGQALAATNRWRAVRGEPPLGPLSLVAEDGAV